MWKCPWIQVAWGVARGSAFFNFVSQIVVLNGAVSDSVSAILQRVMDRKARGRNQLWPKLGNYFWIFLKRLKKFTKVLINIFDISTEIPIFTQWRLSIVIDHALTMLLFLVSVESKTTSKWQQYDMHPKSTYSSGHRLWLEQRLLSQLSIHIRA
jgi:hypothetical protein